MFKVFRGKGRTYSEVTVEERKIRRIRMNLSCSMMMMILKFGVTVTWWWKEGRGRQQCTSTSDLSFYHHPS
jgi:hypothetical protein